MTSKSLTQKNITILFVVIALIQLILAIIGGINHYSPVPFWDMWDGYINFFNKVSSGNVKVWWEQHNEHRILLTRILFWLDIKIFNGSNVFLIIMNYILAMLACVVFWAYLNEISQDNKITTYSRNIIGLTILVFLSSWMQMENFIWAFQSQFFLAQLVPLTSFYLLHKSYTSTNYSKTLFAAACFMGIAATGTMANGIMTLPLMVLLAIVLRIGYLRIFILIISAFLFDGFYLVGYVSPSHHGSLINSIIHYPIDFLKYFLLYIGSPIYHLTGKGLRLISEVSALFLIVSTVFFLYKSIKTPSKTSLELSLITFILFIIGTAFLTAGGRVTLGVGQVFAERYTTPTLMMWSALLVLYAPFISKALKQRPKYFLLPLCIIIVFLISQFKALRADKNSAFEKNISALSLELGVVDQLQTANIYPDVNHLLSVSKFAIEKNISVFNNPLIKDVRELIGKTEANYSTSECLASVDVVGQIKGKERYVSIEGWLFDNNSKSTPEYLHIINENDQIIGYGLIGKSRADVKIAIGTKAEFSGFKGYFLLDKVDKKIILKSVKPDCVYLFKLNN